MTDHLTICCLDPRVNISVKGILLVPIKKDRFDYETISGDITAFFPYIFMGCWEGLKRGGLKGQFINFHYKRLFYSKKTLLNNLFNIDLDLK